jgi:diguanylate cyclase (GGDEF)-like protein/PAS domain S-box-containing protein
VKRRLSDAARYEDLAASLLEAEAALEAVAAGAVDALASASGHGTEGVTALEGSDSFFRTLVTEMQEAAASLDANGTVLYANPRFGELLGMALSQVLGRTLTELTAKTGRPAARRLLADAARGPARGTLELLRGDGQLVPVSVSAAPLASELREVCLVATDLTEHRRYEQQLEYLANHDPLTRLLNRRAFAHELTGHMERAGRYGPNGALVLLDLDKLKYVNDTFGHTAGDELLLAVAGALGERLRASDTLARLGGDEFGVLLPQAGQKAAQHVTGTLLETIRELEPPGLRSVTASAGIALFHGSGSTDDEMMVRADRAMYEAKEQGGNGAAVYVAHLGGSKTEQEVGRLKRLEQAITEGSLLLYAQPIFDLSTMRIDRHELLVRMADDEGGVVPAAKFIPLAERSGLVGEIDRWVCDRAIGLLESSAAATGAHLAVNVSAKSLDADYVAWIERRLAASAIDPAGLTFELTETATISNLPAASRFTQRLRDLGCQLALDDFGAGFGSFTYLRHLAFDVLKIDGQFVQECARDPRDHAVVEALARIAASLDKRIVAEFVGDESTLAALRAIGVDMGQGYHLGAPAPVEEALRPRSPPASPA